MNRRLIRSMLDKAASQFDAKGHQDLADKVDLYSEKLARTSSEREVALIARQLKRINLEAKKRDGGGVRSRTASTAGTTTRERVRAIALRKLAERRSARSADVDAGTDRSGLTIRRLERRVALLERKLARADKPTASSRRSAREARVDRVRRSRR